MVSQSKEERLEEARTTEALMSVVKLDMESSKAMEVLQRRDQEHAAEMSLLPGAWDMGLPQAFAAGLLSLAFFTKGNSVILQRHRGSNSPFGTTPTPASSTILKLSLYTFSLSVSFANTILVSAVCQDKEKILSKMAKAPLVEGKSVLADSFCDDLTREYRRIHPPEYWRTVQSPFLRHVGDFVHNCELRRSYETRLRRERGMMPGEPVSVPPPGVPTTVSEHSDDTVESDFDFGSGEDTDITEDSGDNWADAFSTDPEDMLDNDNKKW